MPTLQIVDCEAAAKAWAKADAGIIAAVGDRVFYSTPKVYETKEPVNWITLRLISETHDPDELAMQRPLVQFDCWGRTKAYAASAVLAVQAAARKFQTAPAYLSFGQTVIAVGDVSQKRWLPDPVTNSPRYSIDVLFAMHGALV